MATLVYNKPDSEIDMDYFGVPNLSYIKRTLYNEINPDNYLIESYGCRLYSPTHNTLDFKNGDILYIDDTHDLSYIKNFLSEEDYFFIEKLYLDRNKSLIIKYNEKIYRFPILFNSETNKYLLSFHKINIEKDKRTLQLIVIDFILQSYISDSDTGFNDLIHIDINNKNLYIYECLDVNKKTYLTIGTCQSMNDLNVDNVDIQRIHNFDSFPRIYSNLIHMHRTIDIKDKCIINIEETFIHSKRVPVKNGIIIVDWYSFFDSPFIFDAPIEPAYKHEYALGLICNGYYIDSSSHTISVLDAFKKSAENMDSSVYLYAKYDADKITNEKIRTATLEIKSKIFFKDILRQFPSITGICPSFIPKWINDSRGYWISILEAENKNHIKTNNNLSNDSFNILLGKIDRGTDGHVNSWISVFSKSFNAIHTEHLAMDIYNKLNLEFPYLKDANMFVAKHIAVCQKTDRPTRIPPVILNGAPGIGKTKWAKRVAELCGLKSHFKNMAGIMSSIGIIGAERGWGTTKPGFWAYAIRDSEIANPLVILDEIDKMSVSDLNGDPYSSLLSFLEKETSSNYYDICLQTRFNLSLISYIMTTNYIYNIPEVFLSRATIIQCVPPTQNDINKIFPNIVNDVKLDLGLSENDYVNIHSLKEIKDNYSCHQSIRVIKKEIKDLIVNDIFGLDKVENKIKKDVIIPFSINVL